MGGLFDLTGKVALVTGGNGGIGLGMAKAMAGQGASVVIWGSNAAKTKAAEGELAAMGGKVLGQVVDVADEAAVEAGMAEAIAKMGGMHAVFANAAMNDAVGPFVDMDMAAYRRVISVNLDGVVLTLRAAARHMVKQGQGGSLVAVSTVGAMKAAATVEAYIASKAALHGLIRSIAVEHGKYGIRANTLVPGFIATEMHKTRFEDETLSAGVTARVPMGRWGMPDDFAGIAVYLASDASRFHSGDSLVLDGAYTAC